jgi:tetratricopeptide (TPR) repeat protein
VRAALVPVLIATALLALIAAGARGVEPLPDDETALVRLPAALAARPPRDLALATRVAREAIERARAERDPRWLGRAQAVLRPWWELADPPPEVLVLRATLRQAHHDFDGALADLDAALRRDPDDAQAWLTRAVVLQVRGELDAARESCAGVTEALAEATCRAAVDGASGKARVAAGALEEALARAPGAPAAERSWALGILAELLARQGRAREAEPVFHEALALAPRDAYLLGALADLLLDGGRAAEVVALLAGEGDVDALLLRTAIAQRRLGVAGAAGELGRRLDAARARGDRAHLREEARFALEVRDDARLALARALEGWAVQREPADARILLEAALAAGQPAAAAPALAHLDRTGLEDPVLRALAARARR